MQSMLRTEKETIMLLIGKPEETFLCDTLCFIVKAALSATFAMCSILFACFSTML